jgi:hypothetical protein
MNGGRYVLPALFLLGFGAVALGSGWLVGWRARHWDAHAFSIERRPTEIRLSYGMGPVLQGLIAFGFITWAGLVVLALASGRGQSPSQPAAVFTLVGIVAMSAVAVWAMRARHASGKDDIVIDLIERRLRIPSYASPRGTQPLLNLDDIERIGTQRVDVGRGKGATIEHRVAATLRGTTEPIVVAGMLTETWACGMAAELGRLLDEANPRVRVAVDLTPVRLKEQRY